LSSTLPNGLNATSKIKLLERLKQILPRASDALVGALLESVLNPSTTASESLPARLLGEQCTPNEIHLALIFCRNAMLMGQKKAPESSGSNSMAQLLIHHDRMISFLIKAVEDTNEQARRLLQSSFLKEGRAHLLDNAISHWTQARELTLFNYYKEMPVSVEVKLLHVEVNGFTIEKKNELTGLISASDDRNSAFARIPDSELSVQLLIEESTRKTLHFRYGDFFPHAKEKRRDVRVQSDPVMHIKLKRAQQQWECSVLDLSTLGFGIACKCDTPFQTGDELAFSVSLRGHLLSGKGSVCWVQGKHGQYRAGISIEFGQESHLRLSNEVLRRQRTLMAELKLRGIPDSLITG